MTSDQSSNGDKKNGYVSWKIFCWAMTIVLILFGTVFSSVAAMNSKVDTYTRDLTEIKIQLSGIQTDLIWIKNNLK
jgi:hypothetical protein